MARFLNHTSHALTSFEHGWHVLAGEVLEWLGYDPEKHGATPGLTRLDPPPAETEGDPAPKTKRKSAPTTSTDAGSGTGDGAPSDGSQAGANNDAAPAAGEEPTP